MAKKRSYRRRAGRWISRRRAKATAPVSIVIPLVASVLTGAKSGWASPLEHAQKGEWNRVANNFVNGYLFYDMDTKTFDSTGGNYLKMLLLGAIIHWGAGKLGINRAIARTKIPYVRI